jgi:hypothetical protein
MCQVKEKHKNYRNQQLKDLARRFPDRKDSRGRTFLYPERAPEKNLL